jgi:hypothetical protein
MEEMKIDLFVQTFPNLEKTTIRETFRSTGGDMLLTLSILEEQ